MKAELALIVVGALIVIAVLAMLVMETLGSRAQRAACAKACFPHTVYNYDASACECNLQRIVVKP